METRKLFGMCAFFIVVGGLATLFALLRENLVLAPYYFMEDQGPIGAVYMTVFLAAWIICGFPSTIVEVLAGFMFGFGWGFLIGFVGKQLASTVSFTLSRKLARGWSDKLQDRFFLLRAINTALKDSPRRILFLVCIAYIPASVKNYGLPLFDCVSFAMFSLATAATGIPYTLMSTWIGATSYSIIEVVNQQAEASDSANDEPGGGSGGGDDTPEAVSALRMTMMIIGGVSSVVLLVVLGVYGRRARRELLERAEMEDEAVVEAAKEEIEEVAKDEERAELESIRICRGPQDDTYVQSETPPPRHQLRRTKSDSKLTVHSSRRTSICLLKYSQDHSLALKLKPLTSRKPLTSEQRVNTLHSVLPVHEQRSAGPTLVSPKPIDGTRGHSKQPPPPLKVPEPPTPRKMTFFEMLHDDSPDLDPSTHKRLPGVPVTPGNVKNLAQMFEKNSPRASSAQGEASGTGLDLASSHSIENGIHKDNATQIVSRRTSRPRDRVKWSPPKHTLTRQLTLDPLMMSTSLPSDRLFLPSCATLPRSRRLPTPQETSTTRSHRSRSCNSPLSSSIRGGTGVTHTYGSFNSKLQAKHSATQAHRERQRQYRYLAKMFVGSARTHAKRTESHGAPGSSVFHRRASVM